MCPRGQGRPRGLHLCSLVLVFGITTVSILVVWKACRKGIVNGFKIAPPSSGGGKADFLCALQVVQHRECKEMRRKKEIYVL